MARERAADYDQKRQAILDTAATLIASNSYDRTSMSSIAEACNVSKSLLYYYYQDKDTILFDIIGGHLDHLIEISEDAAKLPLSPEGRLQTMVRRLLESYRYSAPKHQSLISSLLLLPKKQQERLRDKERRISRAFADAIREACPRLERHPEFVAPVTMSLLTMLNWQYMWFKDEGPVDRDQYAAMATEMIISGVENLDPAAKDMAALKTEMSPDKVA